MPLFGAGILLILGSAGAALLFGRTPRLADGLFRLLAVAGCVLAAVAAIQVLLGRSSPPISFRTTLPGGSWVAGLDALSAWFVLILCVVGAATVVFGVTYLARERAHRRVGPSHALFALLIAAMLGVFAAAAVMPFLLAWELMAVSAYFLIVFEHERPGVRQAGLVYLVLTHAGTLALLGMFLAWGRSSPDLSFAQLTPAAARLVGGGGPILLLATLGFGVKAGVFPFHLWLPGAHAAAPSHVSALLSGVMIKTGIYGLFRVLSLFGAPPPWWAWTILILGLGSALLGVLWSLAEHDLKRALAYSSVDNIGVVLLGLGLGSLGLAYHHPLLALLGFAGALLHSMNHALFKSLLFLGAGAVVHATGIREIDRLGGLARAIPRTAGSFFLGSLAIAGLPPLNGFLGEWTLTRGFLAAAGSPGPIRLAGLGAAAIALIAGLTLACFLRLGGAVFLGQPRTDGIQVGADAQGGIGAGLALLAVGCLALGLIPSLALTPALRVAAMISTDVVPSAIALSGGGSIARSVTLLAAALLLLATMVWLARRRGGGAGARSGVTWGCAYAVPGARMQYTAASFSAPLISSFSTVTLPAEDGSGSAREDRVLRDLALPVWRRLRRLAARLRLLQQGRVTTYLRYIIGTVLLLLGFLYFAGRSAQP